MTPVRELALPPGTPPPLDALLAGGEPVLMRRLARDWPIVREGGSLDYLRRFDGGRPVTAYVGDPAIGGRFFYDDAMQGLNFRSGQAPLAEWLDRIEAADGASYYLGSTDLDAFLPGLRDQCPIGLSEEDFGAAPTVSAWIGNRTVAATHYDMSNNLACCVAGERRFTLFPPEAGPDLYPGPLEPTPAGQVVALADPRAPDPDRFPRLERAMARAQVAELAPGDMLFFPALWWHQVEALGEVNLLVNWWWNPGAAGRDSPMTTLLHGLLSLRGRPAAERAAWRRLFDYYLFDDPDRATAHLPEHNRGDLGPRDERRERRLRARLLQRMNR